MSTRARPRLAPGFGLGSSLALAACLALPLAACKDKGGDKAEAGEQAAAQEIPAKPKNGAAVAAEFTEFIGEGEERGVKVHLYNFGDKTAASYSLLLRYYDKDDELLKVKPGTPFEKDTDFTSLSGKRYMVEPKAHANIELDGRMLAVPADAARAELLVSKLGALADDGKTIEDWWSQDNWSEWPE